MTDPISDMLTRIRNAVSAKHARVDMPASKLKAEIARIPQDEGYIQGFRFVEAPAEKVYATALDLARKNREIRILMTDPGSRRLQIAEGDRVATLNVVEFSPEVSQLMIAGTAGPREDGTASRVVAAVMRVCAEMKKECQLERR